MPLPSSLSRFLLAIGTSCWLASPATLAAPGDPDPAFGVNGLVLHSPGSTLLNVSNTPRSILSLSDGKLLVAGHGENGQQANGVADTDILLARYLANGQLDTGFGHQGIVTTATSSAYSKVSGMLEQADGKLLVYGVHAQTSAFDKGLVVRYLPDGRLDPDFAEGGILNLPMGSGFDQINAAIQQADGKIVVAGSGETANTDFMLARINSDGSLDTTFGTGGKVVTDIASGDFAHALIEQNGKLVAVGVAGSDLAIARYLADGSPDTSFGTDGIRHIAVSGGYDGGLSAYALANGQLLVGARTNSTQSSLLRVNNDGSLDENYALFGIHNLAGQQGVMALRGLTNGKIIAISRDSRIVQLNADGTVDTSFASNGETAALSDMAEATDIIEQLDGRRVLLGRNPSGHIVLARSLETGALDDSFDGDSGTGDGIVISQPRSINSVAIVRSVLAQADGKTVAVGYSNNANRDITLARYLSNGQLDTSFGSNGITHYTQGSNNESAFQAIWQGDKILVLGQSGANALVARFNNDGSLDTNFGSNGVRQVTADDGASLRHIQLLEDGRIFAVGNSYLGTDYDFFATMLTSNGNLDSSFGSNGIMNYPLLGQEYAYGAVIANDQFLLVGNSRVNLASDYSLHVLRINSDGSRDTAFGDNGAVSHNSGNANIRQAKRDRNGKILISGYQSGDMYVTRLNPDGSKDNSFGDQGTATVQVNSQFLINNALAEQADGKIVLAGYAGAGSISDFVISRLLPDGTPDPSFANNGNLILDLNGVEKLFAITQQADGKLVAGGSANKDGQFALLRVEGMLDSDDDGTPDINDDFPNDPTESTDTDNDGIGDNSDAFIDNHAAAVDNDGDGLPDSWNADCDISCQENSGLTLDPSLNDFDNDGLVDSEDSDNSGDNYPPTVTAPPAIRIDATGDLTDVPLEMNGTASANDLVDGPLAPSPMGGNTTLELAPGRHQIVWQATDSNNNTGSAAQQVDIVPLAGFDKESKMSGEGNTVTITVTLNGDAPEYPVIIPVAVSDLSTAISPDDYDATSFAIVIKEDAEPANQGTLTVNTHDDGVSGEYDETVILDLVDDNGSDTLENAVIDDALSRHTVTITELNVAPTLTSLTVSQNDENIELPAATPTLYDRFREGGIVTFTANISDPNPQDEHTFEWVINDVVQPETGPVLVIDPENHENGDYLLTVTVTDNGNPPLSSDPLQGGIRLLDTPAPYGGDGGGSSGGGGSLSVLLIALLAGLGWRRRARLHSA